MVNLTRPRNKSKNIVGASDDISKILQAIANQRWFFFKNNAKILFDRDTALIWAKLSFFPYSKNSSGEYSYANDYIEVKNLIAATNEQNWGGFNSWKIPTAHELWKMISTKTFPFQAGENWRINNEPRWCVEFNGVLRGKNLDGKGATEDIARRSVCVIPCSSALVPKNFGASPQEIFNIFNENNLIPIFDDREINELYQEIFNAKFAKEKFTANFDYKPIVAKYDTAAIKKSPIKYFEAVLSVTDELSEIVREYESAQAETIAEFLKISLKLNSKYVDNPNLTPEKNLLLAERQKFLARRLELNTDEVQAQILLVKAQAENFFALLDKINREPNSIRLLAALQDEPRADFELLVENLARIILTAQRKIDFFAENKNFVASVIKYQSDLSDSYKFFKTNLREELSAACRNASIDEENFSAWYDDWQKKRFAIEQRFLPLVEFALKENFSDSFEEILEILLDYRDSVDKFYLHERKNIYRKFAFQAGGDLQEKFETESALYKFAEKLQRKLQEIIFSREKTEERIFLLRWSEPLLNLPIDELSNFIRDKKLDAISEEILTRFIELRRQNFEKYLADSKSYGAAVRQREDEFNALIFRMRKNLKRSAG